MPASGSSKEVSAEVSARAEGWQWARVPVDREEVVQDRPPGLGEDR